MSSRYSWAAIRAGSRSAATPATPPGREAWRFHQRAHALELRHRGDRVLHLAPAARLGFAGASRACCCRCRCRAPAAARPWAGSYRDSRCCARLRKWILPALVLRRAELVRHGARAARRTDCKFLARNREARLSHVDGNLPRPVDPRGHPDPHAFTAEQKLIDARSLDEALQWLTPAERVEVAGRRALPQSARPAAGCAAPTFVDLKDFKHMIDRRVRSLKLAAGTRRRAARPPQTGADARRRGLPASRDRRPPQAGEPFDFAWLKGQAHFSPSNAFQPSKERCPPAWQT